MLLQRYHARRTNALGFIRARGRLRLQGVLRRHLWSNAQPLSGAVFVIPTVASVVVAWGVRM
jgi:hypothetical protein